MYSASVLYFNEIYKYKKSFILAYGQYGGSYGTNKIYRRRSPE